MICKSLLSKREYHQIRIPCDLHGEKERFESMNFAIIGCGVIAFTHAKALEALRGEDCVLYGACDIIPEKADAYAAEHGVPHVYYDYHDVLADPAVDIVCVCVPSGTHGEVCKAAAEAGKAIVCEKPMEITPEKIADVIGVVERTHAKMQCIFQRRMMPVAIAVKQAVAEGRFGRICLAGADLKYYRDQAYYNSAGWRGTWEQDGGGALMNQCIHNIDLLRWMMGDGVAEVMAYTDRLAHDYIEAEDLGLALVRFTNGSYGVIEGTTNVYPKNLEETLYLFGEKGTVKAGGKSVNRIEEWRFADETEDPAQICRAFSETPPNIYGFGHTPLYRDVIAAVRENRAPLCDARAGRRALELVLAIYLSAAEHRPVALPLFSCASTDFTGRFG